MPVCNKCFIDKPIEEYFKETRKENGRTYIKKYCLDCFRKQARDWKEKNKDKRKLDRRNKTIIGRGGKICSKCGVAKLQDEYYTNRTKCKECVREEERIKDELEREERNRQKIEDGISNKRVPNKPGDFADEIQRQSTHQILTAIGWSYNQENGVFYKLPLKDHTGRWLNLKNGSEDKLLQHRKRSLMREKITIDTLPKLVITKHRRKTTPTDELINQMMYEYFIEKKAQLEICYKYKVGTIHPYISLVYEMLEENV